MQTGRREGKFLSEANVVTYKVWPVLLACLLLISCATPFPVDAEIVQVVHTPPAMVQVATPTSTPQPQASTAQTSLTDEEWLSLYSLSWITAQMAFYAVTAEPLLNPENGDFAGYYRVSIAEDGQALGLDLDPARIADTEDFESVFSFITYIEDQLAASELENPTAATLYTVQHYAIFGDQLLDEFAKSPPTDSETTRGWMGYLARSTNIMVLLAPIIAVEWDEAQEGLQIAPDFTGFVSEGKFYRARIGRGGC